MNFGALTRMISVCFRAHTCSARGFVLMTAAMLAAGAGRLAAQGAPEISDRQPAHAQRTGLHGKNNPAKTTAPVPDPPPPAPVPDPPKWPLNDAPAPASVKWDSHGLQVEAPNSSLRQILDEVASTTGAKVEGLGPDERVFGDYGPGPARDVISQILHGSNYNVLMLGDQGEGTPREIILSQRTAGPQTPQANTRPNVQDDDADQPAPEPEEPNRQTVVPPPPLNQPGPVTPQQRMLEMQRQQMIMQQQLQQQQQQQGVPIQPPPQPPQQ
jgi:hypothetical protein